MKLPSFIRIDKRDACIGAGIGLAVLLLCGIFYNWEMGIRFAVLFLLVGTFRLEPKHRAWGLFLNLLYGLLCIYISCALPTKMVATADFFIIGREKMILNYYCAAIVYGICLGITGEIKSAVTLASGLLLALATVNYFVYLFRGNEFRITDLYAAKTAMNVMGQYRFRIKVRMAACLFTWMWMVFSLRALPKADGGVPKVVIRAVALVAAVGCFVLLQRNWGNIRSNSWNNSGSIDNGYYLNFALGIRDAIIEPPEGYSPETVAALEADYAPAEEDREDKPNIVVIMSESFADCDVLGTDLRTNIPVTPFVDSLRENTIRGHALTSVFGGVTANAEFEMLTGNSIAFLPKGSVPYQQYLRSETYGLVQALEEKGYATFATHPYLSSGWNRTRVYPHMGFDTITFQEDYPQQNLLRTYVSDREMYGYVLEKLQEEREKPLFLFGITMQNHGPYTYSGDNYAQTVFLEGYEGTYPLAEQYLTLLNETDKATEEFLKALETCGKDTVVLFFGDHFPKIENDFFVESHGGNYKDLPERMRQYTVPFFVWANYDIPERTVERTSLNYLALYVLEAAGLEQPPYYQFLADMEQAIPAVNELGYYSLSRQTYLPVSDAEGEEAAWLEKYDLLQHNHLFDEKNRSTFFFGE